MTPRFVLRSNARTAPVSVTEPVPQLARRSGQRYRCLPCAGLRGDLERVVVDEMSVMSRWRLAAVGGIERAMHGREHEGRGD